MNPVSQLRAWLTTGRPVAPASASEAGDLVEAARLQGLAGLLHASLPGGGGCWPVDAYAALADVRKRLTALALRQSHVLESVLGRLAAVQQRVLPLKGAALVGLVYEDTGERPMADLDLLAIDSFAASLQALDAAGWRVIDRADHAVALVDPETDVLVELHLSPTSCPGFYPVDPRGLWERALPSAAGSMHRRPAPEDLLLLLCLHIAFQHALRLPLLQFYDVRRLLERLPPDEEAVLARAAEWRAEATVWAALRCCAVLVGAPVSPRLQARLRERTPWAVVTAVESRLREPEPLPSAASREPAGLEIARTRWLLASGRRLEWLRRTLAPPIENRGFGRGRRAGLALRRAATLAWRWGRRRR